MSTNEPPDAPDTENRNESTPFAPFKTPRQSRGRGSREGGTPSTGQRRFTTPRFFQPRLNFQTPGSRLQVEQPIGARHSFRTPVRVAAQPAALQTPAPGEGQPTRSPSVRVVPAGSPSSVNSIGRPPPRTPPSNFNILPPDIPSDSSNSDDSSTEDDIFPPGCGDIFGLRDMARNRWQQMDGDRNLDAASDSIFGDHGTINSAAIRRRRQLLEGREDDGPKDIVLCVLWATGRFAASYYDLETGKLYMLPDIADASPDFPIMRSIFGQVNPNYVLVSKTSDDRFLRVIHELTGYKLVGQHDVDENEEVLQRPQQENMQSQSTSINVYHLPAREYIPDSCKQRVQALQLPFEPPNLGQAEHIMFVSSLVPFSNEVMVRAMGCLLKFLDKSAIELFQLELVKGHISVTDVILFKMDEVVLVDDSAWRSLQVFSTDFHPSSFKQGNASSNKEGLSVYSILNRCVTIQGAKMLRLMLLRPSRNVTTLRRRYDVIDFCINTNNVEFVNSVMDCLKFIKSIPKLVYRLSLLHATVNEWKQLYQSLYHCLLLAELSHSVEHVPELVSDVGNEEFLGVLRAVTQEMIRVIDFDKSETTNRIVARDGLNLALDKKKKQFACLPEIMSIVASEELDDLPTYVQQCCAVYIPEVGYLLAVSLWRPGLTDDDLRIENIDFRFKTGDLAYYKTPRMRELDVVLGDCSVAILEMETVLMVRLTEVILQKSAILQKISDLVSELDSLIAMSGIAKSNNYIRPKPVPIEEKLKIVNGRHPISDMICEFVPNSTIFKGQERVVILTGPNASGKSVYLKQVGVIVIMALSGSFVPATFAQIPLYDKICTRVHAMESVSSGFSSFMVDISQMSLAIRSSSKHTLVIVDEFGKGTLEADGLSILTASIQDFIDRNEDCPTIFLSTHFSSMNKYLKETPVVKYQSMKYLDQSGTITYLYVLKDGTCETSFAARLAHEQGISSCVTDRALELENVTRGRSTTAINSVTTPARTQKEAKLIEIADEFLKIDFSKIDPVGYLRKVQRDVHIQHQKQAEAHKSQNSKRVSKNSSVEPGSASRSSINPRGDSINEKEKSGKESASHLGNDSETSRNQPGNQTDPDNLRSLPPSEPRDQPDGSNSLSSVHPSNDPGNPRNQLGEPSSKSSALSDEIQDNRHSADDDSSRPDI